MKKIFMSSVLSVAMLAAIALLVACDDSTSAGTNEESSSSVVECLSCSAKSSSSVTESSSSEDIPNSSSDAVPDDGVESSSSVINSDSGDSSSEDKSSSSSVADGSSDADSDTDIKKDGYYKTNCPVGKTCTYAPTEQLNAKIPYGEFLDTRDYQVYKTFTFGSQTWMAQNLNYAYKGVKYEYGSYTSDSTSWCPNNEADSCAKYGRLYTWAAAMDSAGILDANGAGVGCGYEVAECNSYRDKTVKVQGVCPSGWHLPNYNEWNALLSVYPGSEFAGSKLKSTSGWKSDSGDDYFGFSALPAGLRREDGSIFLNDGGYASFWAATGGCGDAYSMELYDADDEAYMFCYISGYFALSVRCIKD